MGRIPSRSLSVFACVCFADKDMELLEAHVKIKALNLSEKFREKVNEVVNFFPFLVSL